MASTIKNNSNTNKKIPKQIILRLSKTATRAKGERYPDRSKAFRRKVLEDIADHLTVKRYTFDVKPLKPRLRLR